MAKNRHCPAFRHCWDDCTDCAHSILYNKLYRKIKKLQQQNKLLSQKNAADHQNLPANWWFITYTNANGEADPHRPMDPADLQRIGAEVSAGAVCGIIKDTEDQK